MTPAEDRHPALDIDLGAGHRMSWWQHGGRDHAGAHVGHPVRPDDQRCIVGGPRAGLCVGSVTFDVAENASVPGARWQVESWEPLTLSPSLACHCGDHGWIRGGRWVPA